MEGSWAINEGCKSMKGSHISFVIFGLATGNDGGGGY